MLSILDYGLECDFCKNKLKYSSIDTQKAFSVPEFFGLKDIKVLIDESLAQYLVFKCEVCGAKIKYTFKDMEMKIRKSMYEHVIHMIATKQLFDANAINLVDRTMIYCGFCQGFTGKGACPIKVYDECILKELPSEL